MDFKLTKLLISATTLLLTPLFSTLISQSALAAQVFTWNQGNNPTSMISTNTGVCFLTSIQGKFEGSGEKVGVYVQNNQWFLGGTSNQFGVSGAATCVLWNELLVSAYSIYGPYTWAQGQQKTFLNGFAEGSGFCFLGSVTGKFKGDGEHVEVTLDPYSREWVLSGSSQQSGVSATAYCIPTVYNYTYLTSQFTWNQNAPTFDLGSGYASCFLTGMKGKFEGDGESVTISSNLGEWYLGGTSNQFGVSASARCFKR